MKKKAPNTHRELELLDALRRLGGAARNSDLVNVLGVSEETVRRTIKSLSKAGTIERVHGGAYLAGAQGDPGFFRRISQHADEKRLIAAHTANMVRDQMTVFLDVGSTTAFVAEELRRANRLTVVSNSIGVVQTLAGINGNRVHLLGGELQSEERGTFGHVAQRQLQRYAFDFAILSTDAISDSKGFLYHSPAEADLAAVVAGQADHVVMAAAHFKFGYMAPYVGPDPRLVHALVTDAAPKGTMAKSFDRWGIDVQVAKAGGSDAA